MLEDQVPGLEARPDVAELHFELVHLPKLDQALFEYLPVLELDGEIVEALDVPSEEPEEDQSFQDIL